MSDIADEIKKAIDTNQLRPPQDTAPRDGRGFGFKSERGPNAADVRAAVRSALLKAHVDMLGINHNGIAWSWDVNDDRILDIIDQWLKQKTSA